MFPIAQTNDAEQLTRAVVQITELLGLYRAEMASILHIQCADMAAMCCARRVLTFGTPSWRRATSMVRFYNVLYEQFSGNSTAVNNWLRRDHRALRGVPLLLIIDHDKLDEVVGFFDGENSMS